MSNIQPTADNGRHERGPFDAPGNAQASIASAVLLFLLNLIGLGLGHWATGLVSDLLRPAYGDESIRYAPACMVSGNIWCATHYHLATRPLCIIPVHLHGDVYASLIGTYKAMGGGWVIVAQRDADETDFPRKQTDSESPLEFPKPTRPTGVETDPGYR